MYWAAHADSWAMRTGTSHWPCLKDAINASPPDGIDLPILLVDGMVAKSSVVQADSRCCPHHRLPRARGFSMQAHHTENHA
jgi:hypothetical protein